MRFSEATDWAIPGHGALPVLPTEWRWAKLREVLSQIAAKAPVAPDQQYAMAGVRWYGEGVFHRETVLGAGMSASHASPLRPGALVYNRLFAWKASFAIVPEAAAGWHVSSEFPQFLIDEAVVVPEYLNLYCLSRPMLDAVNRASVGSAAVSRNRLKEAAFLALDLALPPAEIQREVVAYWQAELREAEAGEADAERIDREARADFLQALGVTADERVPRRKAFVLRRSSIDRWGFDQCWQSTMPRARSDYETVPLSSIARIGSGGTPSRRVAAYYQDGRIPWVKTTEVRNTIVMDTEEHLTEYGLANSSARLYPAGSLIVAMYGQGATRGRTAKLGIAAATNQACCVLFDLNARVATDFLWFYLMSQYDRLRSLASGNNQPNLNAEMVASYPVALPPLNVQLKMVRQLDEARRRSEALRRLARERSQKGRIEVEAMILGTRRAP